MTTVKQIHNAFHKEVCEPMTDSQCKALEIAGFEIVPPLEYCKLFPFNKIVHLNRISILCKKYELLFRPTKDFTGAIPKKNIKELEKFIAEYDYVNIHYQKPTCIEPLAYLTSSYESSYHSFIKRKDVHNYKHDDIRSIYKWFIAASPEMLLAPERVEKAIPTDPIIIGMIKPDYMFDHSKWGVIVTAWGDEASDEAVVNEKMN